MRKALFVGFALAVILPSIGITIVLRRFSQLGDALSHSCLSGVALGLIFGFNPVAGAVAAAIAAALTIEIIRKSIAAYTEVAIVIITSLGIGIAGLLSGFVNNAGSFESFLFGSIVAVTDAELVAIAAISVLVMAVLYFMRRELFYIAFDEEGASISGVNADKVNFIITVLTALVIAISARTIGSLIVSSVLVIPTACAMQTAKSYKSTLLISIVYSVISVLLGIILSYYFGLKPGGAVVILLVIFFFATIIIKKLKK